MLRRRRKQEKPGYDVEVRQNGRRPHLPFRNRRISFILFTALRVFIVAAGVAFFFRRNWESFMLCALILVLFMVPSLVERKFGVYLPMGLEVIVILLITCSLFLGEIANFYSRIPIWDALLHTTNGFMFAAAGFALVDVLNQNGRLKFALSPVFMAIIAFCFSMTAGTLWEFFEFFIDMTCGTDMQKDTIVSHINSILVANSALPPGELTTKPEIVRGIVGTILVLEDGTQVALPVSGYVDIGLIDTIKDMFVNFIGALIFSVIGYFYIKNRGEGRFAKHFVPVLSSERPGYEDEDEVTRAAQQKRIFRFLHPPAAVADAEIETKIGAAVPARDDRSALPAEGASDMPDVPDTKGEAARAEEESEEVIVR